MSVDRCVKCDENVDTDVKDCAYADDGTMLCEDCLCK